VGCRLARRARAWPVRLALWLRVQASSGECVACVIVLPTGPVAHVDCERDGAAEEMQRTIRPVGLCRQPVVSQSSASRS
jgi:hypothetical protein